MVGDLGLPGVVLLLVDNFGVLRVVVVGIGIEYLVVLLVEYLELHEVEALLDEVDVPKVLQVQHELCYCPKRHLVVFLSNRFSN